MNKIIKMLTIAIASIAAVFFVAQPVMAASYTCPSGTIKAGKSVKNPAECNVENKGDDLMKTVQVIINVALSILGIVAVIFIIMGGFTYTTSAGDASKLAKAKNTIIYGVVGLVVALLAFAIVNFVLDNVFNGEVTSGDSSEVEENDSDSSSSESSNKKN